ncbi:MAG: FMN-binding protein [Hungatella sp.]|nr:FMN-binding protein [Hungatella sp.]
MTACGGKEAQVQTEESQTQGTTEATTQAEESKEALYTPGTYTGEAAGYGGNVSVTITVDASSITDVTVEGADETPTIGGAALEKLAGQLKEAQDSEIDGVTGATITSTAVKTAAKSALNQAMGKENSSEKAALTDGVYSVKSTGYSWTGMIAADVTIKDGQIQDIAITEEHESDTAEIGQTAFDLLIPRLLEQQSLAVDSVSGATVTSNGIKSCVSEAITLAGGDPAQWQTPVEKKTDTVKLEGYDVIVVGLGGSGISAYCAAAEEGAAVFGIEKAAKLGGQSATVTGPMVINSKAPAFKDVEFANPDDVYQVWLDYVESDKKADIIHEAVYNSGAYLDYYIDNFDFEFQGMIMSFARPEWSQFWTRYVGENGGTNIFGANKTYQYNRAMEKAKGFNEKNDFMLELSAEDLIFEGDQIAGVKATYYDGTTYEIYGDSVILATGGYIGDDSLVKENFGTTLCTVAATINDGAGIKMGLAAGGATYNMAVDPMIHILQIPNLIKNEDLTPNQKAVLSALALVTGEKTVSITGEALDLNAIGTTNICSIPGYRYYVVYTQEQIDSYKEKGLTENFATATSMFMGQGGELVTGTPVEDMDTILDMGIQYKNVLKGTVKELAEQMGCDEATLAQSLGDEDTTYYAVIAAGYTYGTVGGLDVDVKMNVLKEDGTPIENLFAVGTDSMGVENIEGKPYTPWGGQAQSWTFVSGYLGGKAAAAYGTAR